MAQATEQQRQNRITNALAQLGVIGLVGLVSVGVLLGGFLKLTDEVVDKDTTTIDMGVLQWLHQWASPQIDTLASLISALGAEFLTGLVGLVVVVLLVKRHWGSAIQLIVAVVGAQLLNSLIKTVIKRPRPSLVATNLPGQVWSFPSGHSMVSMVAYGLLFYLAWKYVGNRRNRIIWGGIAALIILAIGVSRMYLGVHYFTDVMAGYIAGLIWLLTDIFGGRALSRWHKHVVPPPTDMKVVPDQSE